MRRPGGITQSGCCFWILPCNGYAIESIKFPFIQQNRYADDELLSYTGVMNLLILFETEGEAFGIKCIL